MSTIEKTVPIKIDVTPAELGQLFARMKSDEQAEFFNAVAGTVAEEYLHGSGAFCMQMQSVTDEDALTDEARGIMRIIGDYSYKE